MANSVKMSGFLPGEERNGLKAHEDDFLGTEAPQPVVAVAVIERKKRTVDDDTDDVTAAIRITAIEPLEGDDASKALALVKEYRTKRTGAAELDLGDDE